MTRADGNFTINLQVKDKTNLFTINRLKCIYSIKKKIIDRRKLYTFFYGKIVDLFQCNVNYKSENILGFCPSK